MQIVKLKEKDIDNYSKLARQIILESPYYSISAKKECIKDFFPQKIKIDIKDKNVFLISAKKDKETVGFIRGFF